MSSVAAPAVGAARAAASAASASPWGTRCVALRSAQIHRSVLGAASAVIKGRQHVREPAAALGRPASTTCVCLWAASHAGQSPVRCLATVQTSPGSCVAPRAGGPAAAPAAPRTTAATARACVCLWMPLLAGRLLRRAATGRGEGVVAGATGSSSSLCSPLARRMPPLLSTTWISRLQLEDLSLLVVAACGVFDSERSSSRRRHVTRREACPLDLVWMLSPVGFLSLYCTCMCLATFSLAVADASDVLCCVHCVHCVLAAACACTQAILAAAGFSYCTFTQQSKHGSNSAQSQMGYRQFPTAE